jgi:bacteriocin biosynthesis cyclodehydratase domain-containing protein
MVPRIDPALPLVWRTPDDLQLGATTPRVVLRDAGALETGLIAALRHGASIETLRTIGVGLGGRPDEVERVLVALRPSFEPERRPAASVAGPGESPVVAVDADGAVGARLTADLAVLGYDVVDVSRAGGQSDADGAASADRAALAVIAATWAVRPARHLPWLRRDVPHLAIVFDDTGARVGPLVEPGRGPCLRCLDLARRDNDSAWPAIAAQLAGRPAATSTERAAIEVAALAVAVIDDRLAHDSVELSDASMALSRERPGVPPRRRRHAPHPECGCRAPGGTVTAPVRLDGRRPSAASSASTGAVPA